MKKEKIINSIGILISKLRTELSSSERSQFYPSLNNLSNELEARFNTLAPNDEIIALSIDMEAKINHETQIDEYLLKALSVHDLSIGGETPEFLLKRKKKTADFYAQAIQGIQGLNNEFKSLFEQKVVSMNILNEMYQGWLAIYNAQQSKGDIMKKVEEVVDIRQILIGALRLLGMTSSEIINISYQE